MSLASAPFRIQVPGRGEVRGKATRVGQLWTLVADGYPAQTQTGYDLVKAMRALEAKLAKLHEAR